MSDKSYPTRMHEVLAVEAFFEPFPPPGEVLVEVMLWAILLFLVATIAIIIWRIGYDLYLRGRHWNNARKRRKDRVTEKMFERLSGDYIRGYSDGIQKCLRELEYNVEHPVAKGKRITPKMCVTLIACLLENRGLLMDNEKLFIRWNATEKGWEVYDTEKKERLS